MAGVLGSWEERFGARVVGVGSAELDVVVTRSPVDAEDAWVPAHEHVAFCLTTRPLSTRRNRRPHATCMRVHVRRM
jgi:hypothetical protein